MDRLFRTDKFTVLDEDPITIFAFEDFVAQDVFARLSETFPKSEDLPSDWADLGGKRYMHENSAEFRRFLARNDLWRSFYNKFLDPQMLQTFNEVFLKYKSRDDINGQWTLDQNRLWPKISRLFGYASKCDSVRLRFEFSSMGGNHYLPPHTDSPKKLISLMLYFPEPEIADNPDLGTEFYAVKPGMAEISGWNAGMKSQDMSTFFESYSVMRSLPFSANVLYGFIKSDRSWHGKRQLSIEPGIERRSLNINYAIA